LGFGAFDEAMPEPIAGCMMKNGAASVATPTISAGRTVGASNQLAPDSAVLSERYTTQKAEVAQRWNGWWTLAPPNSVFAGIHRGSFMPADVHDLEYFSVCN
jgi:hypothetical protein